MNFPLGEQGIPLQTSMGSNTNHGFEYLQHKTLWKCGLLTWPLGWQQGAVAKIQILSEIPFSLRKTQPGIPSSLLVSMGQGFLGCTWSREVLEDFSKRAVLGKTKQLSVCGWKILLGTWGDGHHHPTEECV